MRVQKINKRELSKQGLLTETVEARMDLGTMHLIRRDSKSNKKFSMQTIQRKHEQEFETQR